MRKLATAMVILVFSILPLTGEAQAQGLRWRGGGGWGAGGQYGRLFDANTVVTISGKVTAVESMTPFKGMGQGVHLMLETDTETISVHLGPVWYLERQDVGFAAGDEIEVKGSRITYDGKPAIIAAAVHKGENVLLLRNADGTPMWAGWRRSP
jgi:hypothetical protein